MKFKLLKKNGYVEDLDKEKIGCSIKNAALDINLKLSNKEIELLSSDIIKNLLTLYLLKPNLDNQKIVTYLEVRGIIIETLIRNRYADVARAYMDIIF